MTQLHRVRARIERKRRAHLSTARDAAELHRLLHAQLRDEVQVNSLHRDARAARAADTAQLSLDLAPKKESA